MASPNGYYDRYGNPAYPLQSRYQKVLLNPGVGAQCAELNEIQSIINNRIATGNNSILGDAVFIQGGAISLSNQSPNTSVVANIGGSFPTVGDYLNIVFTNNTTLGSTTLAGSPITIPYQVVTNDTFTTCAAGLVALINENSVLNNAGFSASNVGPAIQISYPSGTSVVITETVTGAGTETITLSAAPIYVLITAGILWANDYFNPVDAAVPYPTTGQLQSPTILGIGTEVLGIEITDNVATVAQDPTLSDPVSTSANSNKPGGDREWFSYDYAINSPTAIALATFIDGQLVVTNNNSLWDQILALLALRTFEESGSFIVERPVMKLTDMTSGGNSSNPAQIRLSLAGGVGYPDGYRVTNQGKTVYQSIQRPITTATEINEPFSYTSGQGPFTLDNTPYTDIIDNLVTVQSPSFPITRGSTAYGSDYIPAQYTPVAAPVVSVIWSPYTYVYGEDYTLSGNKIQWLSGSITGYPQPTPGASYNVIVNYTSKLTKSVNTLTTATPEVAILNKSKTFTIAGNFTETATVAVSGSSAIGFFIIDITCSAIVGSPYTVSYHDTAGGHTASQVATSIVASTDWTALAAYGISAAAVGAVITITYPASLSLVATPITFASTGTTGSGNAITFAQHFVGDVFHADINSHDCTYTAIANDTPYTIATGLALAINTAAISGISAAAVGSVVTVKYPANTSATMTTTSPVVGAGGGETIIIAASTTTYDTTHVKLAAVTSITNGGTTYVLGTDYSVNYQTGVITWLSTVPTAALTYSYTYWVVTIAGDFICRTSFVDAAGNALSYATPAYAESAGPAIDYTKQIYFTNSGKKPVSGTEFYLTYTYALGRMDLLVWNTDGTFTIEPGVPSPTPIAPRPTAIQLPICTLSLPPEAFATNVSTVNFNNQTLLVTDLRTMQTQINTLNENAAQSQLALEATSQSSQGVQKLGVFADPFVSPIWADFNNVNFAGTFDFLANTFSLPRIAMDFSDLLTITGAGAALKGGIWLSDYIEIPAIVQPYTSTTDQINEYQFVNTTAKITLNPPAVTTVDTTKLSVIAQGQGHLAAQYSVLGPSLGYVNNQTSTTVGNITTNKDVTSGPAFSNTFYDIYDAGTPLTPAQMQNSMLWQNLAPSTPIAQAAGLSTSTSSSSVLDQIPIDPDWVSLLTQTSSSSGTGVIQSNQWSTIISSAQITTAQYVGQVPVVVTGSQFIPNGGSIVCLFNKAPVALSAPTVGTVDGTYAGAIIADSQGNFSATFTIPPYTLTGQATVDVIQCLPDNPGLTASIASTGLTMGAFDRTETLYETFSQPFEPDNLTYCLTLLCNILGFQPNASVISAGSSSIAILIAEACIQALTTAPTPITLNSTIMAAAITTMLQTAAVTPKPSAAQILAVAQAINYLSLDPNAIAASIIAAYAGFAVSLSGGVTGVVDPIAQTFTPGTSGFYTSVDLFFATKPLTEPVGLCIALDTAGVPTTQYLTQKWLPAASINVSAPTVANVKTTFTFDNPIYLTAGTEYSFVVKTSDPLVTLYTARLGGNDTTGLGLITKNPSAGAMLKSSNASTWFVIPGASIKANINVAQFTTNQSILNLGLITLPQTSSRAAFYVPFSLPDSTVSIVHQYSFDNVVWTNFAPCVEFDFGGAFASIYLRIVLSGTQTSSPVVQNAPTAQCFIWQTAGAYTPLAAELPKQTSRYTDLYFAAQIPGSTSLTVTITFSDNLGLTWTSPASMTLVTADTVELNAATGWNQFHYTFDATVGVYHQWVRIEVALASSLGNPNPVTPRIAQFTGICS